MYCEMCNHDPCQCDLDQESPCDVSAETWAELYAANPDLLDEAI